MKSWKKILSLSLMAILLMGGFACTSMPEETVAETETARIVGDYTIYTVHKNGNKLSGYEYHSNAGQTAVIAELLEEVKRVTGVLNQKSAMPENLYVLDYQLANGVLYLHFDGNYREMDTATEVLCRAALAKTLTQVEGVEYISIYVDNQPLMDANGTPLGYVTGKDFIENASDLEENTVTLTLYFTDESGTKLVKETRQVQVSNQATAKERRVINELLAGPSEEGHYAVLRNSVKVNSVQVKNGVCYVNLNAAFVDEALNIHEHIVVYSLVNSLTELSTVKKVQIMIDGNSAVTFRGSISFEKPLERVLDYVE